MTGADGQDDGGTVDQTSGSAGGLRNSETGEQARSRDASGERNGDGESGGGGGAQRVSWLELFYDLLFSTAFSRLSQRLEQSLTWSNFGLFALMFVAVWWSWFGNTNFSARYGNASRLYRWGTVAQLFALGALALSAEGDLQDVGSLFALAFAVSRLVLAVMYLLHSRHQDSRAEDRALGLGFALGGALWALSAALPHAWAAWTLALWVLALLTDLGSVVYANRRFDRAQPHQEHFPERVGLLLIILLGAVVTDIVGGAGEKTKAPGGQLPAAAALLTAVSIWRLYFDENKELPALVAARLGQSRLLNAWVAVHLPLLMTLTVLGVGIHYGLGEQGARADGQERLLIGASLGTLLLCLVALRALAVHALTRGQRRFRAAAQLSLSTVARVLAALTLLALIWARLPTVTYLLLVSALLLLTAVVSWLDPSRRALESATEEVKAAAEGEGGA